ncbi:hypothetical protein JB92DRAFT_3105728 [Gautieria morchelliformis]|nr:hypothetical protein JB92DRAFT_3105728 [Gautieria morchelliformis]
MAAPSEMITTDITGTFVMNKSLSDDSDRILELQGVGWWMRRMIGLATVTLHVNHYKDDSGVEHIDIKQTLTGGIEGTQENRTLDWAQRSHEDRVFGPVFGKSRRLPVADIDNVFLKTGWLPDTVEHGTINAYTISDTAKSGREWVADQIWGFEEVNGERRYVRHVNFTAGEENIQFQPQLIYLKTSPILFITEVRVGTEYCSSLPSTMPSPTSNSMTSETKVSSPPAYSSKTFLLDKLPAWVPANLNTASYKLLARSWLAAWAAFLLIIPNHSLNTFGVATFFACMSTIMVPPALPVQVYFYAMALLISGSLLGWAWGCAAMKVALTVRNQVLLLSEIEQATKTAATAANPDEKFNLEVFQGRFLDTSSSIVYGVFLAVGCFFFGLSRAYFKKLALFSVFGTIFLDIICSYGPLFPAANYTILSSFLMSTAASVAIGCAAIVLVFPESLNHQMLTGVSKLLNVLCQLVEMQEKVLSLPDAEQLDPGSKTPRQFQAMAAGAYGGIEKLSAGAPMLSLEFSFGRFNGKDIQALIDPLTVLVSRIAGVQNFSKLEDTCSPKTNTTASSPSFAHPFPGLPSMSDDVLRAINGYPSRERHGRGEAGQTVRREELLTLLHAATADLRSACVSGLRIAETLITRVNTTRWWKPVDPEPDIDRRLDELRHAAEHFKQARRLEVLDPFKGLTVPVQDETMPPMRVLFDAFVFEANLVWAADAIIALLEILSETADRRPKARLWAPKSLRTLWKVLAMRQDSSADSFDGDAPPVDPIQIKRAQMVDKRDPDSRPPTNMFQHVGAFLHLCYKWCSTPQAIYAFKYTFVSVALWLPGVFRTSACSGASAVMMVVPPKSAKTAVRLANASIIFELSQLYGILVSKWIMAEEAAATGKYPSKDVQQISPWSSEFRAAFTKAGAKLRVLKTRTNLARWEGSIRGAWPVDQYNELNDVETEMLSCLAQLASAVYHLDPVWRLRLVHRTKVLNPNFIAEVMSVFLLVSRSLRTGEPLQETLPNTLVDRALYHHRLQTSDERDTTADEHWDQLQSLEFMTFATGVTAVNKLLSMLDRLHAITVNLCGETPLRGFAEWKDTHEAKIIYGYNQ